VSTAELLAEAAVELRELARLEVALAHRELVTEIARARHAVLVFATSVTAGALGLSAAFLAFLQVTHASPFVVFTAAVVLLLCALGGTLVGWRLLPKHPLARTRRRLEHDAKELEARIA